MAWTDVVDFMACKVNVEMESGARTEFIVSKGLRCKVWSVNALVVNSLTLWWKQKGERASEIGECHEVSRGGIVIIWELSRFQLEFTKSFPNFLVFQGQWVQDDFSCEVVGVFASCGCEEQVSLWGNLVDYLGMKPELSWCFVSDFNVVRFASERTSCSSVAQANGTVDALAKEGVDQISLVQAVL
ncbi:hypothetical protein V6N13_059643 [Hibiscus sabdariffa]